MPTLWRWMLLFVISSTTAPPTFLSTFAPPLTLTQQEPGVTCLSTPRIIFKVNTRFALYPSSTTTGTRAAMRRVDFLGCKCSWACEWSESWSCEWGLGKAGSWTRVEQSSRRSSGTTTPLMGSAVMRLKQAGREQTATPVSVEDVEPPHVASAAEADSVAVNGGDAHVHVDEKVEEEVEEVTEDITKDISADAGEVGDVLDTFVETLDNVDEAAHQEMADGEAQFDLEDAQQLSHVGTKSHGRGSFPRPLGPQPGGGFTEREVAAMESSNELPPGLADVNGAAGAPSLRPSAAEFVPSQKTNGWIPHGLKHQPMGQHPMGPILTHQLHDMAPHPMLYLTSLNPTPSHPHHPSITSFHPQTQRLNLRPPRRFPIPPSQPCPRACRTPYHLPTTLELRIPAELIEPVSGNDFLEMYPTAVWVGVMTVLSGHGVEATSGESGTASPEMMGKGGEGEEGYGQHVAEMPCGFDGRGVALVRQMGLQQRVGKRYETIVRLKFPGVEAMRACGGGMIIRGHMMAFTAVEPDDEADHYHNSLRLLLPPDFDSDVLASDVIDLLEPLGHVVTSVLIRSDRTFLGSGPTTLGVPPVVLVTFEDAEAAAALQGVAITMRGFTVTLGSAIMVRVLIVFFLFCFAV
ncbi:hypothetical protein BC829DRAFT_17176 [Chytridium lagenaria]|nr:hypothetical protein BC829DRAFT_17176 [Chytridium lagenaria]